MDIETLKVNLLNVGALMLGMMPVERIVAIIVGITAIVFNVLKIISWFKQQKES